LERQHQIKRTLSEPASIEVVRELVDGPEHRTRSSLVGAVCARFGFLNARGRAQRGSCFKALRDLEAAGHFVLPARVRPGNRSAVRWRCAPAAPAVPTARPATAGEVRGLQLILVETDDQRQIWNAMMQAEHPQGAGPLVGAQLRYLIGSEHGVLGGFGFAASALCLADRDRWIGWDDATRREQLHRVVGMSRFLIRPSVACANLASHVLGLVLRRLPQDFEGRYGYCPWLVESFVDREAFAGTCYQAANFIEIGETQGRGRQDVRHRTNKTVKAIYVYPLVEDFRGRMGVVAPPLPPPIGVEDGVSGDEWAEHEFGGAEIGDQRLSARLVEAARALATMPGQAFSAVAQGDRAAIKGYYRMMDRPDDSEMTMEAILAPHRERTLQRMRARPTVLCIQDGTDLNYAGRPHCEGLGVIGSNQTGAQSAGLHLHSTFVVGTDGLPLGVLAAQCTAPQPKAKDDDKPAAATPIEDKKTFSWIVGLRECVKLAAELPETRQVCVMDREADFFELFDEQRADKAVDLLVRAKHDRCTTEKTNLFDQVRQSEVRAEVSLSVPRQSARAKKSKQAARPKVAGRQAVVAVRYQKVELRPPPNHKAKRPLALWVIHAREITAPDDAEPLEWFLLTTIPITTAQQAAECLRWYCLRWRIEDWHRVLKTGCRVEELQHETDDRLERAIAINMVIAWRIMLMTLIGRACPGLPAEILFSDIEIEVLAAVSKRKYFKGRYDAFQLGDAVRLVAHLGGYIGRTRDPPPGHQIMWRGYTYLQLLCVGYELRSG